MLRLTGAIVLAVSLTACAGTAQAHRAKPTFNVNGQVIAEQDPVGSIQTRHCLPEDSGLRKGAQVVVTDEKGTTLGVDRLVGGSADGKLHCTFAFTVSGVEAGHPFYAVKVSSAEARFSSSQAHGFVTIRP